MQNERQKLSRKSSEQLDLPDMMKEYELTADFAKKLLAYNPETGEMRWKARSPSMFKGGAGRYSAERCCAVWNAKYAGKLAGTQNDSGYIDIRISRRHHRAHRLAFLIVTGRWPVDEIDHVNLNKADNKWENIREASRDQNLANRPAHRDNSSGFKGVTWHKPSQKWQARLVKDKTTHRLGFFDTAEEAFEAYKFASEKHWGIWARTGG
jgi:hypothetical protein